MCAKTMFKIIFVILFASFSAHCREIVSSEQYFDLVEKNVLLSDKSELVINDSPIIGVLAQEISWHLNKKWPGAYTSYIAASYVKFVEGAGARAVPIW